jgi:putative DNA primase/helicase
MSPLKLLSVADDETYFIDDDSPRVKPNGKGPSAAELQGEYEKTIKRRDEQHREDVLESICAADVKMKAIRWLWPDRFAIGKIGIIGGLPDRGKGCIASDMIGRITEGLEWPCGEGRAPKGKVILLTAEDDIEDTVIPRLVAVGADLKCVEIIRMVKSKNGERQFSLISDLPLLKRKLKEIGGVISVMIDPMSAYFGVNKIDSYRTSDVRGVLSPLKDLAEQEKTSIIGIMHFNKNTNVTNAMLRLSDSLAFVAASRHAYVVVDEPDSKRRLFTKAKNNVATRETKALAYTLEGVIVGTDEETRESIVAPRVVWALDHVDMTADQALAAESGTGERMSAKDDAVEFLATVLADGPRAVREIEDEARAACLLGATQSISQYKPMRAARDALGVEPYQQKGQKAGGWFWALPDQMPSEASDALHSERAPDGVEGT